MSVTIGISLKMYFGYDRTLRWCRVVADLVGGHPVLAGGAARLFVLPAFPAVPAAAEIFRGTPVYVQLVFWGLIRTPPEKRDANAIAAGKEKTIGVAKIMDAQLGKTQYMAGNEFSYGDIPVGIMTYRYTQLIPERPATPNLDRWYAAISSRPAFKEQIAVVPLS